VAGWPRSPPPHPLWATLAVVLDAPRAPTDDDDDPPVRRRPGRGMAAMEWSVDSTAAHAWAAAAAPLGQAMALWGSHPLNIPIPILELTPSPGGGEGDLPFSEGPQK